MVRVVVVVVRLVVRLSAVLQAVSSFWLGMSWSWFAVSR